jgi:nickel/cobalt exporter
MARRFGALMAVLIAALALMTSAGAHPLDTLGQLVTVQLGAKTTQVSLTIGGGMLANEMVLQDLDENGDGSLSPNELSHWNTELARDVHITLDGASVTLDPSRVTSDIPAKLSDFHLGLAPIIVTFPVAMPAQTGVVAHRLTVRSDFQPDLAKWGLQVNGAPGATMTDKSWPTREMKIAFTTDPALANGTAGDSTTAAASAWSANRIVARATDLLDHRHSPLFLLLMAVVFIGLGALHAMQPGHGKTLVAAYLVATGGTTRDALTLALIVTATHTVSVFALGLATLGASQFFLPSRVIPIMGVLSGLIVAFMGATMIWQTRRRLRQPIKEHVHEHHHHDHAELSDEAHAQLHLEEALGARAGVSKRQLITLGVPGGLAPCPDALAILLIAIGMGQGMLGLFAIVAFSLGLAGVLVLFGLAIVLAAPLWRQIKERGSGRGVIAVNLGRFARFAPAMSGVVILIFGIAMAWSSVIPG